LHNATKRSTLHRNSADTPLDTWDLRECGTIGLQHWSDCLPNAGSMPRAAASSCVTDFCRDVFIERKTLAVRWKPRVTRVVFGSNIKGKGKGKGKCIHIARFL